MPIVDRNSAIFRLPMGAAADIPLRVDMQNSGFMGALDALSEGTIGLTLSVCAGTDREQSWDFSVSVRNPDTFFVSAVRESDALVFRFGRGAERVERSVEVEVHRDPDRPRPRPREEDPPPVTTQGSAWSPPTIAPAWTPTPTTPPTVTPAPGPTPAPPPPWNGQGQIL